VGILHEINPEQSTIALEDVYSFGTEGRPAKDFLPASSQKFDYIVFRGSDVKDVKIAEEQKENKQPEQSVPNDPAILVCPTVAAGYRSLALRLALALVLL
jgi:protein LSM14